MRPILTTFFLFIFSAYVLAPSLLTYIDISVEISFIHSSAEEEKKNSERILDEIEKSQNKKFFALDFNLPLIKSIFEAPEINWSTIFFEINSPPPELS